MTNQDNQVLIDKLKEGKYKKAKLAVCDIDGVLRGKFVHIDKLFSILKSGFGFCNVIFGWDSSDVCYNNTSYTGWHTGYPDAKALVDPNTLRFIPWDQKVPFLLADFVDSHNKTLDVCPRSLLKRINGELNDEGFSAQAGCEFEWFNFKETSESLEEKNYSKMKPLTPGMFGYSLLRASENSEYFNALMDSLREFRVPLEGLHTETGPGVYEAALSVADPLEACDRAVLFKSSTKELAKKHNVMASFMARWSDELPGCSGHIHLSLEDSSKQNLFSDASEPHKMSKVFKHFLAGLIHGVPHLLPLFAPTVNSYKRLVEGFWAPTRMTWGVDNRTCAFRVINLTPSSTRIEVRVPGSDMNPYLSLAGVLACGLYGIRKGLELKSDPIKGNAYEDKSCEKLASNLYDATVRFSESSLANELLGENFVRHFAATRLWEWQQSQKAITDWELRRYFEII